MSELIEFFDPPELNQQDGWHGNVHIYAPPTSARMNRAPTLQHFPDLAGETIIADCCLCKMDPAHTVSHGTCSDWHGWSITHECADGFGCVAKPRRRSSRHLREGWYI